MCLACLRDGMEVSVARMKLLGQWVEGDGRGREKRVVEYEVKGNGVVVGLLGSRSIAKIGFHYGESLKMF